MNKRPFLNLSLIFVLASPMSAATINWISVPYENTGPNRSVMGIDEFDQSGFEFLAVNLGTAGAQTLVQGADPDINFTASDPKFTVLGGLSLSSGPGTFHDNIGGNNNISGSAIHSDFQNGEVAPGSFRLSGLVEGETYLIQTLHMDFNTFTTDVYFDGAIGGAFGENIGGGVDGLLGLGLFTADATTQDFTIQVTDFLGNPQGSLLNAIYVQSRNIPEPSSALLAGLAMAAACLRRRRQG